MKLKFKINQIKKNKKRFPPRVIDASKCLCSGSSVGFRFCQYDILNESASVANKSVSILNNLV